MFGLFETMFGLSESMMDSVDCIQKRLLLPAQQSLIAHMERFEQQSRTPNGQECRMRNTHVDRTSARASSTAFAKSQHIPVAALQLGQRHTGSRVEGTVCCKAVRQVAVQILLEDAMDSSHAVKVSLYNLLPTSAKMTAVHQLLPEGTKLAIRDPYYKIFMDGTSGIRVDNPADVVFLTKATSPNLPTAVKDTDFDEMKAQGNQAFRYVQLCKL